MRTTLTLSILAAALAGACTTQVASRQASTGSGSGSDPTGPTDDPARYIGLGGEGLANRQTLAPGAQRLRIKPFSALAGEYPRVLGNTPAALTADSGSFGAVTDNFFNEPTMESGAVVAAHTIALAGCTTLVDADSATYGAAASASSAATNCTAFAHRFWSRDMATDEQAACTALATTPIVGETNSDHWSRVCAAVLTSAGFLTY